MIDEAELRELLESAAAGFEIPAEGEARVLAAATAPAGAATRRLPRLRLRRPRLVVGLAAGLVVVLGIFALGTLVGSHRTVSKFSTVGQPAVGNAGSAFSTGAGAGGSAGVARVDAGSAAGAAGTPSQPVPVRALPQRAGPTNAGMAGANVPAQPAPPQPDTAKVVKTGSLQIEVRRGAVGVTMTRLANLATGVNGYLADTKTAEEGDDPTGSVTLRVPAASFDDVVARVRGMGTVKSITTHGQDVTAQYSDIQARLTALTATRSQLLTILQKATAIGDVLAVQDRINQVQTEIEQLQGQQKLLDDQTSYAALSVDVSQQGAKLGPPQQRVGLAKAWYDAHHGFTNGVEWLIARSGTALLVLLVLVAAAAVVRVGWLLLRRRIV